MDKYNTALMGLLKKKKFFYKNLIIHNCWELKKKILCKRNIKTLDTVYPSVYSLQATELAHACGDGSRITLMALTVWVADFYEKRTDFTETEKMVNIYIIILSSDKWQRRLFPRFPSLALVK